MTVRRLFSALLAAAALLALCGAGAGAASAATPKCAAKAGTLLHSSYGRAWHKSGSLYSCTTVYGHKRVVRLGPWKTGGKLAWSATHAAWSVPGPKGDRVYAGSTENGRRWLVGTRALGSAEARIQRMFVYDTTAAWVTKAGAVMFGLEQPQEVPTAIGAATPTPLLGGHLVLVGTWATPSPTDLGRTIRLDLTEQDGDECGGAGDYRITLAPADPATRIGVSWFGAWERPFCG
jgi:hypothetical protein